MAIVWITIYIKNVRRRRGGKEQQIENPMDRHCGLAAYILRLERRNQRNSHIRYNDNGWMSDTSVCLPPDSSSSSI